MSWYPSFTRALADALSTPDELRSLVARDPEQTLQWTLRARCEFRMGLWRSQVASSKALVGMIRGAERALQAHHRPSLAQDDPLDPTAAGWLLNAVNSRAWGDQWNSRYQLGRTSESRDAGPTLLWLADIWRARVEAHFGDIEAAEEVLLSARRRAKKLDREAREATSCVLAEVEACADETQLALERVDEAIETFAKIGDSRWLAAAWLTRAKILQAKGFDIESVEAAQNAHKADSDWAGPTLMLARRSLEKGLLDDAETKLLFVQPPTGEVARELALVRQARSGDIPLWAVSEYVTLRDAVPTERVVGQLRALVSFHPAFVEARVTLAWGLLRLEQLEQAEEQFRSLLAEAELESSTRLSVLNGLECTQTLREQLKRKQQKAAEQPAVQAAQPLRAIETAESPAALPGEYRAPGGSPDALSGDLALLSLPELLEFMRSTKRTGVLALSSNHGSGSLCFISGMLVKANSPSFPTKDEEQLPDDVSAADSAAIVDQMKNAVREFLPWQSGQFAFQPSGKCTAREMGFPVELDPQQTLIEAIGF